MSRSSTTVTYERVKRIAILSFNRPDAANALNSEVMDTLRAHIATIAASAEIRAVVLTGAGSNFSLGADFDEFAKTLSLGTPFDRTYCDSITASLADVVTGLYQLPVPLIAAVNGQAAGAGFSLALACDFRLAEDRTRFNFAYGALGASTDGGMSWLLPRIVGVSTAMRLLLEQPIIRAGKALELGLVSDIAPKYELIDRAISLATHLANNAAHSNRTVKRMLRIAEFATLQEHMEIEHEAFADGLLSIDMRRALAARECGEMPEFE